MKKKLKIRNSKECVLHDSTIIIDGHRKNITFNRNNRSISSFHLEHIPNLNMEQNKHGRMLMHSKASRCDNNNNLFKEIL